MLPFLERKLSEICSRKCNRSILRPQVFGKKNWWAVQDSNLRPPACTSAVIHLRAINGKATGQRYEWKPNDPFLKKLPELIKAQEEKEQAAKKKA